MHAHAKTTHPHQWWIQIHLQLNYKLLSACCMQKTVKTKKREWYRGRETETRAGKSKINKFSVQCKEQCDFKFVYSIPYNIGHRWTLTNGTRMKVRLFYSGKTFSPTDFWSWVELKYLPDKLIHETMWQNQYATGFK